MNLRNIDLNLLHIFDIVYADNSITIAAEKLSLSQPAVSNALNRLRAQLGDPLFKRDGKGITPTVEAIRLAPLIHDALKKIEKSITTDLDFDPETSEKEFNIAMPDALEPLLLYPLINQAMLDAPHISFSFNSIEPENLRQSILSKKIDIALFVEPIIDDYICSSFILPADTCIVARAEHPVFGDKEELSENDFFDASWVTIGGILGRSSGFHREIKAKDKKRKIVCQVSRMLSVSHVVANSNLIGTMSRRMAEHLKSQLNLKIFEIPFAMPPDNWHMIWHTDQTDDPTQLWLRNQIKNLL